MPRVRRSEGWWLASVCSAGKRLRVASHMQVITHCRSHGALTFSRGFGYANVRAPVNPVNRRAEGRAKGSQQVIRYHRISRTRRLLPWGPAIPWSSSSLSRAKQSKTPSTPLYPTDNRTLPPIPDYAHPHLLAHVKRSTALNAQHGRRRARLPPGRGPLPEVRRNYE